MNLLLLADMHGRMPEPDKFRHDAGAFDLVLLLGDITNFGDDRSMGRILDGLAGWPVLGVAGNCDKPAAERELERRGLDLDSRAVPLGGFCFAGAGRSLPCPGTTPNETDECDLRLAVEAASASQCGLPMVLVTHQSPLDTAADLAAGGRHVGSSAIRRFIDEREPVLACCGHIHEARSVTRVGRTTLVNPGPWRHGFWAAVELLPDSEPRVTLRQA